MQTPRSGTTIARMTSSPTFLFVTCQVGAEPALKSEVARVWPQFRFAYSRPGFVTFKLPEGAVPPDDLDLECIFARAHAFSLGKATRESTAERAGQVWDLLRTRAIDTLHVWPRDAHEPGAGDYEPGLTAESHAITEELLAAKPPATEAVSAPAEAQQAPGVVLRGCGMPGQLVGDVVLVGENEWWVGYHRVHSRESSWPGGLFPEALPAQAVSRVYLKMKEAIVWSGIDMRRGQRVAEIGCAPGGASQALLEQGLNVLGIDPAEMAPVVIGHPRFRHIRGRSKEVRRREFLAIDWLTCDINLPPNYALDTVEAILTYPGVRVQGTLLTLKLVDWSLARLIPAYLKRIRKWGFAQVRARQLHHNRREICVAAFGRD